MNETRQCSRFINRLGRPCHKAPIRGGTVCWKHGGAAPQVQRAAKLRLLDLVDPAIAGLLRALTVKGACDKCGRSDDPAIVVRAAQIVLDRTGFGPSATVAVEAPPPQVTEAQGKWPAMTQDQLEAADALIFAARAVTYLTDEEITTLQSMGSAVRARVAAARALN